MRFSPPKKETTTSHFSRRMSTTTLQRVLHALSDILQKTEYAMQLLGRGGGQPSPHHEEEGYCHTSAFSRPTGPAGRRPHPHHDTAQEEQPSYHQDEVSPTDTIQVTLSKTTPTSLVLHVMPVWCGRAQARALSIEFVEYVQKALTLYHPAIVTRRCQSPHEIIISCVQPGVLSANLQESLKHWLETPVMAYTFENVRATYVPGADSESPHASLNTMMLAAPWRLSQNSVLHVWVKDIRAMERIAKFKRVRAADDALADLSGAGALMPFPWQISVPGGDSIWRVLYHCGRLLPRVAGHKPTPQRPAPNPAAAHPQRRDWGPQDEWDAPNDYEAEFGPHSTWNPSMNCAGLSRNGQ